jgi:hypothetical protein
MDRNKKQHWFLLSFMVPVPGSWQPASLTVGRPTKVMQSVAMEAARDQHGFPASTIVTGVSYLGYASAHQMQGTSDEQLLTKVSEEFRQGMRAAVLGQSGQTVSNPYTGASVENANVKAQEWDAGFREVTGATRDIESLQQAAVDEFIEGQ